jgi:hypothetical protein
VRRRPPRPILSGLDSAHIRKTRIVVVPTNIRNQFGRRKHSINEPYSIKFHGLLLPVKETTHNTSPSFKQAYSIWVSVPSDEIIGALPNLKRTIHPASLCPIQQEDILQPRQGTGRPRFESLPLGKADVDPMHELLERPDWKGGTWQPLPLSRFLLASQRVIS